MDEQAEGLSTQRPERRKHPRVAVEDRATLILLQSGDSIPCALLELSREGCRVRADREFRAETEVRLEIGFRINGVTFRLSGITVWTHGKNVVGLRFLGMSTRRSAELDEILVELETAAASKGNEDPKLTEEKQGTPVKTNVVSIAAASPHIVPTRRLPDQPTTSVSKPIPMREANPEPAASAPALPTSKRERRTEARHSVDSQAGIFLLDVRSLIQGRILDVSMAGGRIRCHERFPVGIYRRVEVEFVLDGLPFRLAGVVQAVHDHFTVGIRFLDVSERKKEQLAMLLEELSEMERDSADPSR